MSDKIACFTGHRPEKLTRCESEIVHDLEDAIQRAAADGYNIFLTGMAPRTDLLAAETVLRLHAGDLICALPHPAFGRNFPAPWRERFEAVFLRAVMTRCLSAAATPRCYQTRNRWMVDHASLIIAITGNHPGGTENTLRYAVQCGKSIWKIPG